MNKETKETREAKEAREAKELKNLREAVKRLKKQRARIEVRTMKSEAVEIRTMIGTLTKKIHNSGIASLLCIKELEGLKTLINKVKDCKKNRDACEIVFGGKK